MSTPPRPKSPDRLARDKPAQLAQLQELLAAGSLTPEEHAQLKAEIVNHA